MRKTRPLPKDWEVIRGAVLLRDKFACRRNYGECSGDLAVHHILSRRKGGTDDIENLVTLCESHHKEVENVTSILGITSFVRKLYEENWKLKRV